MLQSYRNVEKSEGRDLQADDNTMPPKRTALKNKVGPKRGGSDAAAGVTTDIASNTSAICAVCKQSIVDVRNQALYCKGVCQQWIHR